ncbi:hypothetical protein GCM10020229_11710 [Kitasatospora albolonga]
MLRLPPTPAVSFMSAYGISVSRVAAPDLRHFRRVDFYRERLEEWIAERGGRVRVIPPRGEKGCAQ